MAENEDKSPYEVHLCKKCRERMNEATAAEMDERKKKRKKNKS